MLASLGTISMYNTPCVNVLATISSHQFPGQLLIQTDQALDPLALRQDKLMLTVPLTWLIMDNCIQPGLCSPS